MEFIEGLDTFKYMGLMLDRLDDDWPVVCWNSRKVRRVWSRRGGLIRREWAEPQVSSMFYQEVVQAVLLFGK